MLLNDGCLDFAGVQRETTAVVPNESASVRLSANWCYTSDGTEIRSKVGGEALC